MSAQRDRTMSSYEEAHITAFVNSCVNYTSPITFHSASEAKDLANLILLVGTEAELLDPGVKSLCFYDDAVEQCIQQKSQGSVVATFTSGRRICVGIVPSVASRHNCPVRPDVITSLVSAALGQMKDATQLDIFARSTCELTIANAVAKGLPSPFTTKGNAAEKGFLAEQPKTRVFFCGDRKSKAGALETVTTYVQLCRMLVDAPTNLCDTVSFPEIASKIAEKYCCSYDIIRGEELRERGYGGIYGVGKAAEFPPALVTLTYKPKGMDPKDKISMVGKGIVYDTGGLALKTPANFMLNMKSDMGGAAAVMCGFLANVALGVEKELSVTLCCADNAVGPRSQRNDDIVIMKSGLSVEITNTDAEGRLVLGDGVYHASHELSFTPTMIIDMATLTGAQGIATGKHHAGVYCNTDNGEKKVFEAGRASGDTVFPVLYCPEYHNQNFKSPYADYTNNVKDRADAQVSCAGQFVGNNIAECFKGDWIHVDLAFPSNDDHKATGFGVTLLVQLISDMF